MKVVEVMRQRLDKRGERCRNYAPRLHAQCMLSRQRPAIGCLCPPP
eukprot:COSAG01_NODE_30514_length_614_cov_1.592233_1_plen_45_part_10